MNTSRLLFGGIIILIGALFLLNGLTDVVNLRFISKWWPLILILFGVWLLIAGKFRNLFMPLLLIVIGGILQAWQLDIGLDMRTLWPAILIAVGVGILTGGLRRRRRRSAPTTHNSPPIIDVDVADDDHTLNLVLGSQDRRISGDFHSGSVNVVMGSGSLDLRNARIVRKPAVLEASVVMGEAKVRVPANWSVRFDSSAQMGETKDTRRSQNTDSGVPDLIISGSVTMGSLQIED